MKVKTSGSFRRYVVAGGKCEKQPDPLKEGLEEALFESRFRSIENLTEETRSVGWSDGNGLVPANFGEMDVWLGSTLVLGVRIDVKRIPAGALKVRKLELESRERQEVGARIPPDRKRELAEKLELELLAKCVPATAVYQMLWDTKSGQLLFSTTSDAPNVSFRSLFRETFGRNAEPVTPGSFLPAGKESKRMLTVAPVHFTARAG